MKLEDVPAPQGAAASKSSRRRSVGNDAGCTSRWIVVAVDDCGRVAPSVHVVGDFVGRRSLSLITLEHPNTPNAGLRSRSVALLTVVACLGRVGADQQIPIEVAAPRADLRGLRFDA